MDHDFEHKMNDVFDDQTIKIRLSNGTIFTGSLTPLIQQIKSARSNGGSFHIKRELMTNYQQSLVK